MQFLNHQSCISSDGVSSSYFLSKYVFPKARDAKKWIDIGVLKARNVSLYTI